MTAITIPLDVDDVTILAVEYPDQDTIRITVESDLVGPRCRRCGRWMTHPHGTDRALD